MANNITIKDALGVNLQMETEETSPGSGIHSSVQTVKALPVDPLGTLADNAIITDTTGSLSGKIRGLVKWAFERMPASLGQKTMANSLPVVLASDYSISVGNVQLNAGENHVGEVACRIAAVTNTPTITASTPYTIGNNVGGVMAIANCARIATGNGILISAMLFDKTQQGAAYDLLVFDANPTASTFTDAAAAVIHTNDIPKLIGSIRLKDYISVGVKSFCQVNFNLPFVIGSGTTLYFALVLRAENGVPTYGSTTDLVLRLWVNQN